MVLAFIAPGRTASSVGSFVDGLPTAFEFGNGGIFMAVDEGTDLLAVGTGGSFTVDIAPVPLPASWPFLLSGLASLGLLRRRPQTTG
ncbi:MAG: VPLPA-CTERM sorting domain-containing protein [Gammaproteobacteria bacterium]